MATATILSIIFNFVTCGDHTYKAIWMLNIGGHSEPWVKDGDNHNTFAIVFIMTECTVGYVLKAITYHHLLLKICTVHAVLFKGALQLKLITKIRLFVLK